MTGDIHSSEKWVAVFKSLMTAIDELGGAVIGGAAVSLRSVPRFTRDVDAICWQGDRSLEEVLQILLRAGFEPRSADPIRFARSKRVFPLLHTATGIGADVSIAALPFERELIDRAQRVPFSDVSITVATPEDLVVLKLIAGRPIDISDVSQLIQINPGIDRKYVERHVRAFAEVLEILEPVETMKRLFEP